MVLAITANGPGEFSGWVRPLLSALAARAPQLDVRLFFVPDDYATGRETAVARALFPHVHVYPPREYVRFALGAALPGMPARADQVLYLGGDLLHAARLHARLGGAASSYKFARRRDRARLAHVFAVDAANRATLLRGGIPPERMTVVGNLAIDGALGEAAGTYGDAPGDAAPDGIVILPGSRPHEVANLYPFFVAVALQLRRRLPGVPIAFARSPFTTDDELAAGLHAGGHPRIYGVRAELAGGSAIRSEGETFPLVGAAMRSAAGARLALTIPGTKLIELAALGVPAVACIPLNAPELAVINGPLQYLGRIPAIGVPLKRAAALAAAARFRSFAQPNMDAGRELIVELTGTLFPARVAAVVAERYADAAWCARTGADLRALYAAHAGAAARMAGVLLDEG